MIIQRLKKNNYKWAIKNIPTLGDISDIVGRDRGGNQVESSLLFLLLCRVFKKQLRLETKNNSNRTIHIKQSIVYRLFKLVGPLFLNGKKIQQETIIDLPKDNRPLIFAPNHGFVEDCLTTVLVADRQAFILFGSLPQYFNTFNGIAASLNGSILVNRKNKGSRKSSVEKAVSILERGGNLLIFPEGVWNKSPNKLMLDYWPGIVRIAKRTNALIIPVVNLLVDKTIHSSRLTAIDPNGQSDDEALMMLRTAMSTELYTLMEKYSHSTRENILKNSSSMAEACDRILQEGADSIGKFYDYPFEITCAYQRKDIVNEQDVFRPIAELKPTNDNIQHVIYARQRVKTLEMEDYQHRY